MRAVHLCQPLLTFSFAFIPAFLTSISVVLLKVDDDFIDDFQGSILGSSFKAIEQVEGNFSFDSSLRVVLSVRL